MADPVWLPDVLKAAGLQCDIYEGAFERGHGDFTQNPSFVIIHHTGATGSPGPGAIAKHPELGLCSQLHLDRSGKYTLCGVGIAWHAGPGAYPGLPTNDANRLTIGIEAENNGTEGWSEAQYKAYVVGVAAILRKLGKNSSRVIGHKEWAGSSQGKWDPGSMDMNVFRKDVQKVLDTWAVPSPAPKSDSARIKEIRDQLVGYDRSGKDGYVGWEQLGGRTIVDALAAIGEHLGIEGFKEPK